MSTRADQLKVLGSVLLSLRSGVDAALGIVQDLIEAEGQPESTTKKQQELMRKVQDASEQVKTFGQRTFPNADSTQG